jgi:hypothetical protein
VYTGAAALAQQASLAGALPLAYLMQGGFDGLKVKRIALAIDATDAHKQLQIEDVTASRPAAAQALNIRREGGNSEGLPTKSTTIAKTAAIQ